jgi:queuine tRNA-ribosyltransferase
MKKDLTVKGKTYKLPIYLTDATRAVTKSLDSIDMVNAGVKGAVVNTYHLMETPGIDILQNAGGVKGFMNYDGLVVSDSGGWQIFSLIKRNNLPGKITDEGVTFKIGVHNKKIFTPEDSIRVQFGIKSDIIVCLDDFSSPVGNDEEVKKSVYRTIDWAKRSKIEYEKIIKEQNLTANTRPLIFAVIQGHFNKELRKYCADELIKIGFDGYGYGGYPFDPQTGNLDLDISEYVANLIPDDKYKFALGIGRPQDIIACASFGWEIFDCTLPTRDARHKRLYVADGYIHIGKSIYSSDFKPIEQGCDCHTCRNFTRAYLHHLFKIGDVTAFRLASIHNLKFYTGLIESLG